MYKAIKTIDNCLSEKEIKHNTFEVDGICGIRTGFGGDNTNTQIQILAVDENDAVKIMTSPLAKTNKENIGKVLLIVNSLNARYKFAKFTIDFDGELVAQCDIPVATPNEHIGEVALELILRLTSIVDEAYPAVMKAAWA